MYASVILFYSFMHNHSSKQHIYKANLNFWNFFMLLVSLVIFGFFVYLLDAKNGLPTEIKIFDFILISLAVFRLTRLFVADEVSDFFHAMFQCKTRKKDKDTGEYIIVLEEPISGIRVSILHLLECLWCTGVWASIFVTFAYFYFEFAWFIILVLAIAGLASFIHLIANATGWTAENIMKRTQREE